MDLFDLMAKITLDTSEYDRGLGDASGKTAGFADKLKSGLATAAKVGVAAVTAVAGATTAMAGAVVKSSSEIAAYGDNIDKMSQKMGMSATAYQEWDAVMQHSGTSIESMQSSMKTLAAAAETGHEAFEKLGITQAEIASMSQEELFGATITALQNVESETERTYLAGQLLGRGATELGALLNTSAEDTQAMKDRVHELGGVMSDEAVKAAAAYQDSLQDMQTAFSGISRGLISEFLPSITTVMDGLTEVFSGNGESGLAMIKQGLANFADTLGEVIPKVIQIGGQILQSLAEAVIENLPALTQAATEVIPTLIQGIASALPAIVESAVQILQMLATAIVENLPALADAAVEIILSLVDLIIENLPQILAVGIQILGALAMGLIQAIPKLLMAIPRIIGALIDGFCELLGIDSPSPAFAELGGKIIAGLLQGITAAWDAIVAFFSWVIGDLIAFLSDAWETIRQAAAIAWELITAVFSAAWQAIQAVFSGAVAFFSGVWNGIQQAFAAVAEFFGGVFSAAWAAIRAVWDAVVGFFMAIGEGIRAEFEQTTQNIATFFTLAWEGIKAVWNAVVGFFTAVGEGVQDVFAGVTQALSSFFREAWEAVKAVWNTAVAFFSGVWKGITGVFSGVRDFFSGVFAKAWDAIKNAWSGVIGFFQGIWDGIVKVFSGVWDRFCEIGDNIVNGIRDGVAGAWDSFLGWLSGRVSGIVDFVKNLLGIHSPSTVFAGIGENMALGLGEGWMDAFSRVKGQIEGGMQFSVASVNGSGGAPGGIYAGNGAARGGDTYNFYSPKALDAVTAAREMTKARRQLAMGFCGG